MLYINTHNEIIVESLDYFNCISTMKLAFDFMQQTKRLGIQYYRVLLSKPFGKAWLKLKEIYAHVLIVFNETEFILFTSG